MAETNQQPELQPVSRFKKAVTHPAVARSGPLHQSKSVLSVMRINCIAGWFVLASAVVAPVGAETGAQTGPKTLLAAIAVSALSVTVDDASYVFDVVLSDYKVVRGVPVLRVSVSVTRTTTGGSVRFRDINQVVTHDRSSVTITVDKQTFVLEASYRDPFDRNIEPRLIPTTIGEMFRGGKVGVTVKVVS